MNKKIFDKITDVEDDTYFHILCESRKMDKTVLDVILNLDDTSFVTLKEEVDDVVHCTLFLKNYYYNSMRFGAWGTIEIEEALNGR